MYQQMEDLLVLAPLINRDMKVIDVHKLGIPSKRVNVATKIYSVKYSINTLFKKKKLY